MNSPRDKSQLIDQILVNRYLIHTLLSQKTGRRTFIAQDTQTNTTVVIKLLLFGADFSWDDLKLFQREAEVLQDLNYPAIPRYLDHYDVDTELGKGFALVQTYIEAKSLQEWVQSGRTFDEEQLKSIARSLLEILDYLHHQQPAVVHRDIKPSNILLGDRSGHCAGQVYLVDFGSVQTAIGTGTITIVGTYGYMPPEQFGGKTSPASDLYALGATLIYLATGQHPAELPHRDLRILFESQVILHRDMNTWLKYLTEPSLEKRCDSAQQALTALNQPQSLYLKNSAGLLTRPVGTEVRVENSVEILRINIPLKKVSSIWEYFIDNTTIFLIMLGVSPFLPMAPIYCFLVWIHVTSLNFSMLLFSLICTGIASLILWTNIRNTQSELQVYGQIELLITKQSISWNRQAFGKKYQILDARRQNISQIEMIQDRYLPNQINIWAGVKKFEFGENLTKPELEWLAQECSIWLNLPITRNNNI